MFFIKNDNYTFTVVIFIECLIFFNSYPAPEQRDKFFYNN